MKRKAATSVKHSFNCFIVFNIILHKYRGGRQMSKLLIQRIRGLMGSKCDSWTGKFS